MYSHGVLKQLKPLVCLLAPHYLCTFLWCIINYSMANRSNLVSIAVKCQPLFLAFHC